MKLFKDLRDGYVKWHANKLRIPAFDTSPAVRKHVVFSGRVQKVGFRLELYTIAQRLELTGWVKNREDGRVEAELQGEEAKVDFLIEAMQSLKRASVDACEVTDVPLNGTNEELTIVRQEV